MLDIEFWRNFLSNTLATLIGAIIGIPVALWINRLQQKASDLTEKRNQEIESDKRKRKIISLISDELNYNKTILANGEIGDLYKVKIETWRAISDGGELQWIQDLDILNSMSMTYYALGKVIYSVELTPESTTNFFRSQKVNESLRESIANYIDTDVKFALSNIEKTLDTIRQKKQDN